MAYPQALWESQATEKFNTGRRAKNKYEMKQFKLGEIVTRCGMGPACVVFGCLVDPGFVLCYKHDGSNVQAAVVPGIDGQHNHIVFAYMDVVSLERSIHKAPTEVQSMYDRYLQGMNDTNELWAWKKTKPNWTPNADVRDDQLNSRQRNKRHAAELVRVAE